MKLALRKIYLLTYLCVAGALSAVANEDELTVSASVLPPCVITANGTLAGFAIELWSALAEEIKVEYSLTTQTLDVALEALEQAQADVVIGCISVTQEREKRLDFTHPIAEGGLQAVSLKQQSVIPRFSKQSLLMLLFLLGLVVFFAHLMWLSERGFHAINDKYFPGVIEAIWFSVVTMSTVGYGDIAPKKWFGRIIALLIILLGVTTFGLIVGQFAVEALKPHAKNPVESIQDLHTYQIGTKGNTATVDFLTQYGVESSEYATVEDAIAAMEADEVDIVVHDSVAIQYQTHKNTDYIQTGPTFNPHYLGFALPEESELTEKLNVALLKLHENGRYKTLFERWFSWE